MQHRGHLTAIVREDVVAESGCARRHGSRGAPRCAASSRRPRETPLLAADAAVLTCAAPSTPCAAGSLPLGYGVGSRPRPTPSRTCTASSDRRRSRETSAPACQASPPPAAPRIVRAHTLRLRTRTGHQPGRRRPRRPAAARGPHPDDRVGDGAGPRVRRVPAAALPRHHRRGDPRRRRLPPRRVGGDAGAAHPGDAGERRRQGCPDRPSGNGHPERLARAHLRPVAAAVAGLLLAFTGRRPPVTLRRTWRRSKRRWSVRSPR